MMENNDNIQTDSTVAAEDRRRKRIHFASGFLGWFLINGVIWLVYYWSEGVRTYGSIINLILLPANIIALVVLGIIRRTRYIALGIMTAWTVNLVMSLALSLLYNGVCLVPFFFPIN